MALLDILLHSGTYSGVMHAKELINPSLMDGNKEMNGSLVVVYST